MKIEGSYNFEAPRQMVFDVLQDPAVLAKIIPGCEELNKVGENEYDASLNISVGPVKGKFKGKVILSEINSPESYTMEVNGQGTPGFVKGVGHVKLGEEGTATIMNYDGDAHVGGRIASVGQRLVESTAKSMIKTSLEGVHDYIQAVIDAKNKHEEQQAAKPEEADEGTPVPPPPPPPVPQIKAPSQLEFATDVAKGVVDDLVPHHYRRNIIIGGAVALILLFILTRGRKKNAKN